MDLRLKQLHERYVSMQSIDSSTTSDKIKDLYEKLTSSEIELMNYKANSSLLNQQFANTKKQLEISQEELDTLKLENRELLQVLEESKTTIAQQKQQQQSNDCTNKILENKLLELKKVNDILKIKEKETSEKLMEKESLLKVKGSEVQTLQDAFEKSTGLVVGSFKELKDELNNQLKEKTEVLLNVNCENEELSSESKTLLQEKSELQLKTESLEEKLLGETRKREDAEKTVLELKAKLAEEMKHEVQLQQFLNQLSNDLDETDQLDSEDGLLKKKKSKSEKTEDGGLKKKTAKQEKETALKVN